MTSFKDYVLNAGRTKHAPAKSGAGAHCAAPPFVGGWRFRLIRPTRYGAMPLSASSFSALADFAPSNAMPRSTCGALLNWMSA